MALDPPALAREQIPHKKGKNTIKEKKNNDKHVCDRSRKITRKLAAEDAQNLNHRSIITLIGPSNRRQ